MPIWVWFSPQKLWGVHPEKIDPSWRVQRVKGFSFRKLWPGRARTDTFLYPKYGPGQLWETAAAEMEGPGGRLIRNCEVTKLVTDKEKKRQEGIREMRKWVFLSGLTILAAMVLCGCGKKEESYRNITVMSMEGSATVERASAGLLDAYVDMRLESGDQVSVGEGSNLVLDLDSDKYILVESGAKISLEASGDSQDSRTVIHLASGAVVNQLTTKLTEDSSYEVTTPNSTMAVRGTVFRVVVEFDAEGVSHTCLTVLDGSVGTRLIFPDGSVQDESEEKIFTAGNQVGIHGDEMIFEYDTGGVVEIEFDDYSIEALNFLNICLDNGAELVISDEELDELIQERSEDPEESSEEDPEEEEEEKTEEEEEETKSETASALPKVKVAVPPEPGVPAATSPLESSGGDDSHSGNSSSRKPVSGNSSSPETTYTVTFKSGGSTFCTQTVTSGETATVPTLMPSPSGSWTLNGAAYDFSTAVTGNLTLIWTN